MVTTLAYFSIKKFLFLRNTRHPPLSSESRVHLPVQDVQANTKNWTVTVLKVNAVNDLILLRTNQIYEFKNV